jgi:choline monooxygenase
MNSIAEMYRPTLEQSTGLPGDAYTSEAVFREETRQLFFKSWLCIGTIHDISEQGDIVPVDFAGIPLLLTKDREGQIRVFHNVCPHRGAQLADSPKHCHRNIVCPYHSWAFDFEGNTVRTPHAGGAGVHSCDGIDLDKVKLSQVPSAQWYDMLFVNISGDAVDFEEFIAPIQQRIGNLDPAVIRYDRDLATEMQFKANWKLVVENFVESYHVPGVHPELERVNPMRNHYQILGGHSYIGQGGTAYIASEEDDFSGLPERPDLEDIRSYEAFYIYPNLIFGPIANFAFVIIIDPQSPDTTNERVEFMFYGDDAMTDSYYELRKANAGFLTLVNNQDIAICEKAQRGRISPAYNGGIFALPQEATSLHFIKLVAANMLQTEDCKAQDLLDLAVENIYHDQK